MGYYDLFVNICAQHNHNVEKVDSLTFAIKDQDNKTLTVIDQNRYNEIEKSYKDFMIEMRKMYTNNNIFYIYDDKNVSLTLYDNNGPVMTIDRKYYISGRYADIVNNANIDIHKLFSANCKECNMPKRMFECRHCLSQYCFGCKREAILDNTIICEVCQNDFGYFDDEFKKFRALVQQ